MYRDRTDAGGQLARHLDHLRGAETIVLALPRGGVVVGYEVAEALEVELDVLIVRKLGAPFNPELGFGAIASGGARYIDEEAVQLLGLSAETIRIIEANEQREMQRRIREYRDDMPPPQIAGRSVILVDDGLATGGTARAAIRAVRQAGPARLVLAVPVAPAETVEALREEVDELVCPYTPAPFYAIGLWYDRFEQTSDQAVRDLLQRRHAGARSAGR